MATRAYPSPFGDEPDSNPEEWRALRSQLVELLDQVETEYAREGDLRGIADRMKSLREQVRSGETTGRHQQALRSVKRAIDRFSDRDDGYAQGQREALESAINEIRGRPIPEVRIPGDHQRMASPPPPPPAPPAQPRIDFTPQFDEIGRSVSGISGRLERLEAELKAQRSNPDAIKEIAGQVAQVSQVVELLAKAVGETTQVQALEAQISSLAKLVTQGQRVDLSAITQRIDGVSSTVERLADLQVEHVSREKELPAQQAAMKQAIEQSVRTLYDRIELIEKNFLIAPGDVHRLMDEMGQLADAMRNPTPPQHLVALIDALNSRIDEIETGGREVRAIRGDIESMRQQLLRMDLSSQQAPQYLVSLIEALNARIDEVDSGGREVRGIRGEMEAMRQQLARLDLGSMPQHIAAMMEGLTARLEDLDVGSREVRGLRGDMEVMRQQLAQLDLGAQPQQIAGLIDGLNSRIDELDSGSREVRGIKSDLESMRQQLLQRLDLSPLNQRLDDVSGAVDRLTDLQSRDRDDPQQASAIRSGVQAIEKSMRALYDRIDSIEQSYSMRPDELEKVTAGLARITEAIQNPEPPHQLITLVDALNARIGEIESRGSEMAGLRHDMADLREAVLQAVEPRLQAVETQLFALNERVAEQRPIDIGATQLEAQVRQLVARMDQTGEQITGLARLYSEAPAYEAPNYEALADMIAARTSAAVGPREAGPSGLSENDLNELERRMVRLFEAAAHEKAPQNFSEMYDGIRRVDERLERLEDTLDRLKTEMSSPAIVATPAPGPIYAPEPEVPAAPQQIFSALAPTRPRGDAMPVSPSEERPLADRPFADLSGVRAALEARAPSRKMHPGLGDEPMDLEELSPITPEMLGGASPKPEPEKSWMDMTPPPAFDPANVPTPPRPTSSFDFSDESAFSPEPARPAAPEPTPEPPASSSSRNTFIEAARRAAQRPTSKDSNANSLISRALARFQQSPKRKADEKPAAKAEKPAKPAKPEKPAKPAKAEKVKVEPKAPEPLITEIAAAPEPVSDTLDPGMAPVVTEKPVRKQKPVPVSGSEPAESFLVRHRQPILLAASVVALSFLTLNLINQRNAEDQAALQPTDGSGIEATEPAADLSATPAVTPLITEPETAVASTVPTRVIPIVDSLATGAIDPAAQRFAPAGSAPKMPEAFKAIEESTASAATPPAIDSPVKVELPPETVGPLDLRQAAADGDARAQFEVAAIYTEGRAVPQDLAAAAMWYERAAAQGFSPAQYRLASLYENGKGVEKDLDQARLWYQRAADAGNRMSMHNLAALYAGGELGKQDFVAAAGWFEKAATQGMTDSQFNLGMLYARGLGVPQNMDASYKWFALAARNGDEDAAKARDDIARSLDAETMTRLTNEIEAWTPASVDLAANYAPIGTWSKDFDPGQVIDNREVILGVQTLLSRLGYDVGVPDGVAGPKTAEAIKSFEAATGMSQVGAINPRLLAVLGSQPG